jgi:ferric-chelate reductase
MKPFTLLLSLLVAHRVQCLTIIDSILATQCIYYLKGFDWGCNSTSQNAKAYKCRCNNIEWMGSVTSCLESQGTLQGKSRDYIDHAYEHVRTRCLQKAHLDWPIDVMKAYQENASHYLQNPTAADYNNQLFHPLSVNETSFTYYKNSFQHIYDQVMISQGLQWGFVFFWVFVILCGAIFNFSRHFLVSYVGNKRSKFTSPIINKLRSSVTLPNLFNKSYVKLLFFWSIHLPKTYESVVLFFFIVYSVLASSLGYSIMLPNAYMNGYKWQIFDLIGYRTALGSFALIPITFFFGIRNNPFIRLTGSSLTTFLHYHKWSAWMMAILALVHSAVWTDYTIREGDYSAWAMDSYWQWGIAGTAIVFLMLFFACGFFREIAYEVFLLFHELFGIFFIVAMWKHCDIMGWMGWIYAVIVIWVYDRLVRFLSILWNGGAKTAKVTKLNDGLVRVLVERPNGALFFPGCYNYYYFLNARLRFYQSHPFSVMKSKRSGEENLYAIVFKVHNGITKKILNQVSKTEKRSMLIDVLTEGPYGSPIPSRTHEQFIFIAAGVGFTPCYSQAVDLVEKNLKYGKNVMIKFIWVITDLSYFELFRLDMDYLIQNGVELQVIFTRESQSFSKSISEEETKGVQFIYLGKRPNVQGLAKSINIESSTCFVSSGPVSFVDDVRTSVSEMVKTSDVRIDLYEESFNM